mgnify:CR=1 FL=1
MPNYNSMDKEIDRAGAEPVVIGQHPPAGTNVPRGSSVDMILGTPNEMQNYKAFSSIELNIRLNKWIGLSMSPALLDAQGKSWFYTVTIQQLAYLDKRLIEFDQNLSKTSPKQYDQMANFEHLGLSAMWVTMGFQVLYVMKDNKIKKGAFSGISKKVIEEAKKEFIKLRSPFAHNTVNEDDFPFPYQGALVPGSAAWVVNDKKVISRLELADVLLKVLIKVSQLKKD